MKKFIYVMFEDVEKVIETPNAVCDCLADILEHQAAEGKEFAMADEQRRVERLWHLFAYHALNCRLNPDTLNLALAHKAIVEEGQDFVEAYERVS